MYSTEYIYLVVCNGIDIFLPKIIILAIIQKSYTFWQQICSRSSSEIAIENAFPPPAHESYCRLKVGPHPENGMPVSIVVRSYCYGVHRIVPT